MKGICVTYVSVCYMNLFTLIEETGNKPRVTYEVAICMQRTELIFQDAFRMSVVLERFYLYSISSRTCYTVILDFKIKRENNANIKLRIKKKRLLFIHLFL